MSRMLIVAYVIGIVLGAFMAGLMRKPGMSGDRLLVPALLIWPLIVVYVVLAAIVGAIIALGERIRDAYIAFLAGLGPERGPDAPGAPSSPTSNAPPPLPTGPARA